MSSSELRQRVERGHRRHHDRAHARQLQHVLEVDVAERRLAHRQHQLAPLLQHRRRRRGASGCRRSRCAIAPSVLALHGATIIPSVWNEPLEIAAPMSAGCVGTCAPAPRPARCEYGVSCSSVRAPHRLITRCVSTPASRSRSSSAHAVDGPGGSGDADDQTHARCSQPGYHRLGVLGDTPARQRFRLCTSCGVLVGVNDDTCYNCGRRNPGLWGFAPALRSLGERPGLRAVRHRRVRRRSTS